MITDSEIRQTGSLGKPHGIGGEITALIPEDIDIDLLRCIVVETEGIYVPFFIEQWRPKSSESVLLKLEGIDNEIQAKNLANKPVFVLREDLDKMGFAEDSDGDGFYTADIIGFTVRDSDGTPVGKIKDYDDQTENILILVELPDNREVYLPLADDLIEDFDPEGKTITLDIPLGIIE